MIAAALIAIPLVAAALCALPRIWRAARVIVTAAAIIDSALSVFALLGPGELAGARIAWAPQIGATFAVDVDALTAVYVALAGVVFAAAAAGSGRVGHGRAYHGLLALTLAGIATTLVARDLALFFVGWEGLLAPLALLIWQWGSADRRAATLRFVSYALCGDALVLVAVVSLAVARGTLDIDALAGHRVPAEAQLLPALLFIAGFAIRVPLVPMHAWLTRLSTAAPLGVLAVLLGAVASTASYAILRVPLFLFPQGTATAATVLVAVAAVGAVYTALLALRQDDLRRVIAFVSVSQLSLVAVAMFCATVTSLQGAVLLTLSQGVTSTALCLLAAMLARRSSSFRLSRAGGLAGPAPALASAFGLAAFAAVGVPGTLGFAAQLTALAGAYERFPAATAVGALAIVLNAAGMARVMRRVFHGPPLVRGRDLAWRERAVVVPLLVIAIAFGVAPRAISDRIPESVLPAVESQR